MNGVVEPARILVVDDEYSIRLLLSEELSHEGYEVATAASGEEALVMLEESKFDLMLLDLKMPGIDGLEVMEEAAQLAPNTVVIMLTAHATLDSAIEAMRHGGYDYLLKPSTTEDILASVEKGLTKRRKRLHERALIRQMTHIAHQLEDGDVEGKEAGEKVERPPRFIRVRELLLDREQLVVTLKGRTLDLTPTEFKILLGMMENVDRVVSFNELAEVIHGRGSAGTQARGAISTHVWRLRRKLEAAGSGEEYIVNVRGRGYRLPRG